jgi:hypothetical protein
VVSQLIAFLYWVAPNVRQPGYRWISPGGLFAVVLWVIASAAFAFYVSNFGSYNKTYGSLAAVIIFLMWLWITNVVILLGAEMNAEIEHASPYGKDEGEKVPGEKRKIGPARMRAWIAARRRHGEKAPTADEVKEVVSGAAPVPVPTPAPAFSMRTEPARLMLPPARRFSEWIIGLGVMGAQVYWAARSFKRKIRD